VAALSFKVNLRQLVFQFVPVLYSKPLQDYPAVQSKFVHSLRFGCLLKVIPFEFRQGLTFSYFVTLPKKTGQSFPATCSPCLAGVLDGFSARICFPAYIKTA
jgi:hypothetical protein